MGSCHSKTVDLEKRHSNKIDTEIMNEIKVKDEKHVKILLLGASESGKSTIVKQMKIINLGGYTEEERIKYRNVIYSNISLTMKNLDEGLKTLNMEFMNPNNQVMLTEFLEKYEEWKLGGSYEINEEIGRKLMVIWSDAIIQEAMERASEFYLPDSAFYYMSNIERLSKEKCIPDNQDILRSRMKTTGIAETTFVMDPLTINLYDVGGQRSERKKWIHCFEGVTSVIFVIGLTEYNQTLAEDANVNRLQESIQLFDSIVNSRWFIRSSIIFFMNKTDLFRDRLKRFPLELYYSDYVHGADSKKAAKFILLQFLELNHQNLKIYPHYTNATDTSQIKAVFTAIKDTLAQNYLKGHGLL